MNKKLLVQSVLSAIAFLFLFGCAVKEPAGLASFSAEKFDTNMYESKVDNFVVVLDASSSMRYSCKNVSKFTTATAITERLNLTIPELGQTAGLRSFGHAPEVSKNHTELFYGMEKYDTKTMNEKLLYITKPGGWSPLGKALDAVQDDLDGLSGIHNAVVIISDGLDMNATLNNAQALKDKYGSSVCFYPIQVGESPVGKALLQEIANIGDCGFYSTADQVMTGAGMAAFVEKAFLKKKPAAPKPVAKVERKDSDGDGVYDDEDKCPGTPVGAKVNAVGCWTLDHVLFDFDKAVIKAAAYPRLDEVVVILKKNPAMSVELQGHTDNVGTKAYNMDLSLRRSNAVAAYLVGKGILRNRLATTGYGYQQPVALNGTDFGRSLNRRVELHPY
ncbi:MAG: cell envelope biogenesis protein OmpA [Desulfobacteraceae bacterium 4572_89]|nr:MAG: cell envelope biogenesis protein OmpA [Desulfobacteraceae bacterium 4572_89]